MKFAISCLTAIFLLSLATCSRERKYVYPQGENLELQRICRAVTTRNTNRFMVILGKIYPLNNDGYTVQLENISTSLPDAGYFCGTFHLKNSPCFPGKKRRLDNSACSFSS